MNVSFGISFGSNPVMLHAADVPKFTELVRRAEGYGALDAARGALGHWVQIEDGKITRYQCVVPSTWNCSPRDAKGVPGPYEAALMDHHPLVKPDQPLEILRTIHSFDPCLACAVHLYDPDGKHVHQVQFY